MFWAARLHGDLLRSPCGMFHDDRPNQNRASKVMGFNSSYLRWRLSKLRRRVNRAVCSSLYRDRQPDIRNSILVAGVGRSGTTWLADIIASQVPCRIMFEPFRSDRVEAFRYFHYYQYMRPEEDDSTLYAYCEQVLMGRVKHSWIDWQVERLLPERRLIKEVRANLFLRWMHHRFPDVPLLFIIRHPCAVVLSRMQLNWATDGDIQPFLRQPKLIEDFLADKRDLIDGAVTPEEKHAVIWCVSNLVPLSQLRASGAHVFFYEDLCTQPELEVPRVFQAIGHGFRASVFGRVNRPSSTATRSSAVVTGQSRIFRWKQELSADQADRILSVVQKFGLDYLYGNSPGPLVSSSELLR